MSESPAPYLIDTPQPGDTPAPVDWNARQKHRVFGHKAVLAVEEDTTRQGIPTLALEMAPATAPRIYDWAVKIRLQLTRAELLNVAGVLLGLQARADSQVPGERHDKGFALGFHEGALLCRLNSTGKSYTVKISPAGRFALAALAVRQIQSAAPWLDTNGVIALLSATLRNDSQGGYSE